MTDANKIQEINSTVEQYSMGLLSIDGVLASLPMLFLVPGDYTEKLTAFGGTLLSHQLVHNMIDNGSTPNFIKEIDRRLPGFIPLDGITGTAGAYYFGGYEGAAAFAAIHGTVHPNIVFK